MPKDSTTPYNNEAKLSEIPYRAWGVPTDLGLRNTDPLKQLIQMFMYIAKEV